MKPSLKTKLRQGDLALGSWITLGHPAIAEIMASAGYDWLAVDLEHSVITIAQAEELIRVISLKGVTPMVRLTNNDANLIKRVMDAGAGGIIVPMVKTAEEAKAAVGAVYYPPRGYRGVGLARAQRYGNGFADYQKWLETEPVVIAQIEHIDAVRNAESILSTEGIDGYILGPYDLSASMGMPGQWENPEVVAAFERVREVAKKLGKPGGIHQIAPDPVELKKNIGLGYRFLAYSLDIRFLDEAARAGMAVKP